MTSKTATLLIALASGLWGCSPADQTKQPDAPSASAEQSPVEASPILTPIAAGDFVKLERAGCELCPVYTVRVGADGNILWSGKQLVEVAETRSARIDPNLARALLDEFRTKGFWNLNDHYESGVTDNETVITTLHIDTKEKRVSNYAAAAPSWLTQLERRIDAVADTHRWVHGDPKKERLFFVFMDAHMGKPGVTPLMQAAADADFNETEKLLAAGADPNAQDASGWTALVYAAVAVRRGKVSKETFSSGVTVVKMLLDRGANPNLRSFMDHSPLMAVTMSNTGLLSAAEKAKLLIAAGADVNAHDKNGQTALMGVIPGSFAYSQEDPYQGYEQKVELFRLLRAAGARTDLRNAAGFTVLVLLEQEYRKWISLRPEERSAMETQYEMLKAALKP